MCFVSGEYIFNDKNDWNVYIFLIFLIGEISFGKLSIINLFFGYKILLFDIEVFMLRVCRVKYFEKLIIIICNEKDEELKSMMFKNIYDMVMVLEVFVKIGDFVIRYVDIMVLIDFIKVSFDFIWVVYVIFLRCVYRRKEKVRKEENMWGRERVVNRLNYIIWGYLENGKKGK